MLRDQVSRIVEEGEIALKLRFGRAVERRCVVVERSSNHFSQILFKVQPSLL